MYKNTSGNSNTSVGHSSLSENLTGDSNTAIGYGAGDAITSGSSNVYVGHGADASAGNVSNEIVIGSGQVGAGTNTISLGNTSITHIKAQVTSITAYSDKRIKREIYDSNLGLAFIKKLRPVTYKMKNPADYPNELLEARFREIPGNGPFVDEVVERPADDETIYDGLIAQEVKEAMDEVGINWSGWSENESDGKQGVQYGALTIPLIKAIQELSSKIEELEKQQEVIDKLKERVLELEKAKSI